MPEILRLDPHAGEGLRFDLGELLTPLAEVGPRLHWRMIHAGSSTEIELRDDPPGDGFLLGDVVAFGHRVDAAPHGLPIAWDDLRRLGDLIFQTSWATFLGFETVGEPDLDALFTDGWRYIERTSPAFSASIPVAIQSADGSWWSVHLRDEALLETYCRSFPLLASPLRASPINAAS